jgi:hypothetical protein
MLMLHYFWPHNVIEDELHFLFECSKYDEDRESMLFEITTVCSNFRNLNSQNKLIWLFNSENIELLKTLCKFVSYPCLKQRGKHNDNLSAEDTR